MDPFSAITSTVGLIDVLWRVGSYLGDVKESAGRIEGDITALQDEIDSLITADEAIENLRRTVKDASLESQISVTYAANELWDRVEQNREGCKKVLLRLEEKVRYIIGKDHTAKKSVRDEIKATLGTLSADGEGAQTNTSIPTDPPSVKLRHKTTGKLDGIRKTLRRQSTDPELARVHLSLDKYHHALQALLAALNLVYTQSSYEATDNAIGELSNKTDFLHSKLTFQLKSLREKVGSYDDTNLRETIIAAAKVASRPLNKHFSIPEAVKSYFIGRTALLDELQRTLDDDDSSLEEYKVQKRFVVQGLGGSGKTQFCCKFAELNRQKFWGVFYINGSSHEAAREGFAAISKIGAVEPNERAAKTWLSSLEQPWLLIIDNADDPSLQVDSFFPEGERGFILITTRVPDNVKHGTVGPKWYIFEKLESDAATDLLLERAQVKRPWDEKTINVANSITSALGHLPLALVHAGTAIANKLCELGGYLVYFKMFWDSIRQARKNKSQTETAEDDLYMSVYSSYEVIYRKLEEETSQRSRDAVELLKIFAFFNRENIRFDALVAAAKNPSLELAAEKKAEQEKKNSNVKEKSKSWTQLCRELLFGLRLELLKDHSQPILPSMLRDVLRGSSNMAKFEYRLRDALHVLRQWSLATYHEEKRSYSMHPLVHVWVRERPQMTLGEQAVWSQAATNALGQSISLPIQGTPTTEEMQLQRSLLLHVMNLRARKKEIREKFRENQHSHTRLLPVIEPASDLVVTDRHQARQAAKFSYIYFICGYYRDAEKLQEAVRDFLVPNLGLEHELSMRISLFLAKTYSLGGGRFNDAATLTEEVLQAAENSLGERHSTTLSVMDELGIIRVHQGRFPEAEDLFRKVIKGRTEVHGPKHQETLCSIDNLGHVYWNVFDYEKAKKQHLMAVAGMESHPQMGPDHDRTLAAKENLAMTYREIGEAYYKEAHDLMEEVAAKRMKILGREAPYTLVAKSNLAYIKHAMGDYAEAEKIFRAGLPIAERNLGEDHHGVMAARRRLAETLAAQRKYDEAEEIFLRLLDRDKYAGGIRAEGAIKGDYKDRIFTLYQFVLFWEKQNKLNEALDNCEELCVILTKSVHPIAEVARNKRKDLQSRPARISSSLEADSCDSSPISPGDKSNDYA